MPPAIVDSTVVIHLLRKLPSALVWFEAQTALPYVTPITWLEVLYGAPNKQAQQRAEAILQRFQLIFLIDEDQTWAIKQMKQYRFSHGVAINDCLIAAVSSRLQYPIYTHNVKHFNKLLPSSLIVQPY